MVAKDEMVTIASERHDELLRFEKRLAEKVGSPETASWLYEFNREEWNKVFKKGYRYYQKLEKDKIGFSWKSLKAKIRWLRVKDLYSGQLVDYTLNNLEKVSGYLGEDITQ